ncbi:hypothetical protein KGF56_003858 [Candida oxycetoniae]|uniref:Uncharacterized protein n=1 Tax=Candida oxycetoniae TaxID=497107 RepID=A0AAI9SVI4_9ASCO|nr:uncharacterized protein KGF56_003858 [Candida oxycetoniae]KAI3403270.2 hypothetical protein KGF56_003858 [Candida oxycetoniae]
MGLKSSRKGHGLKGKSLENLHCPEPDPAKDLIRGGNTEESLQRGLGMDIKTFNVTFDATSQELQLIHEFSKATYKKMDALFANESSCSPIILPQDSVSISVDSDHLEFQQEDAGGCRTKPRNWSIVIVLRSDTNVGIDEAYKTRKEVGLVPCSNEHDTKTYKVLSKSMKENIDRDYYTKTVVSTQKEDSKILIGRRPDGRLPNVTDATRKLAEFSLANKANQLDTWEEYSIREFIPNSSSSPKRKRAISQKKKKKRIYSELSDSGGRQALPPNSELLQILHDYEFDTNFEFQSGKETCQNQSTHSLKEPTKSSIESGPSYTSSSSDSDESSRIKYTAEQYVNPHLADLIQNYQPFFHDYHEEKGTDRVSISEESERLSTYNPFEVVYSSQF